MFPKLQKTFWIKEIGENIKVLNEINGESKQKSQTKKSKSFYIMTFIMILAEMISQWLLTSHTTCRLSVQMYWVLNKLKVKVAFPQCYSAIQCLRNGNEWMILRSKFSKIMDETENTFDRLCNTVLVTRLHNHKWKLRCKKSVPSLPLKTGCYELPHEVFGGFTKHVLQ